MAIKTLWGTEHEQPRRERRSRLMVRDNRPNELRNALPIFIVETVQNGVVKALTSCLNQEHAHYVMGYLEGKNPNGQFNVRTVIVDA